MFNIPKFTPDFEGKYPQLDLVKVHLPEIGVFARALHSNVVLPLLRLFAIVLQKSEDHLRYMIYRKRTPEEYAASEFGQSNGHTDLGTVTLLFRQPIAGLQILDEDENGTYVSA